MQKRQEQCRAASVYSAILTRSLNTLSLRKGGVRSKLLLGARSHVSGSLWAWGLEQLPLLTLPKIIPGFSSASEKGYCGKKNPNGNILNIQVRTGLNNILSVKVEYTIVRSYQESGEIPYKIIAFLGSKRIRTNSLNQR